MTDLSIERRWTMIETLLFGRTSHLSTRTIFGAAALSQVSQIDADRTSDRKPEIAERDIQNTHDYI